MESLGPFTLVDRLAAIALVVDGLAQIYQHGQLGQRTFLELLGQVGVPSAIGGITKLSAVEYSVPSLVRRKCESKSRILEQYGSNTTLLQDGKGLGLMWIQNRKNTSRVKSNPYRDVTIQHQS